MTWIVLAFGVAFFQGSVDTLTKSALRTHRARTMALVRAGWCAAFLFPLLIFAAAPSDPGVFWGCWR